MCFACRRSQGGGILIEGTNTPQVYIKNSNIYSNTACQCEPTNFGNNAGGGGISTWGATVNIQDSIRKAEKIQRPGTVLSDMLSAGDIGDVSERKVTGNPVTVPVAKENGPFGKQEG